MRWGGRGPRARPASGRSPSSFLPYWKGQGDSRRTQSLLPRVPITSAARGRVAGGGAARKPMRQASSRFLPGTDATLDTAGDICWPGDVVGLQDTAAHWTHCRRGQRPHGSHSGWRGPWRRSCWHRPIPANPADIPRAGVSHGRLASAYSSLPLERYPKGSRLPEFPNPGVCLRSLGVRLSAAGPVEMRLLPHGGGRGGPREMRRAHPLN